nr:hypothetical protein Iba_chr06cCG12690 [Ipomoea batatas]
MYRNSVRAHSRRRNAFGGKILETRTSLPSENKGQLPCHVAKSLLASATFTHGFRMSDSDSQNAFGRDYDEGDEAVSESSSPSTGGSTFNQIDEVEHGMSGQ